jgi:hypothetical protein
LDLHGVSHGDAPDLVHRFINDHWTPGWHLYIITGSSEKMKSIVMSVANMYDLDPQEHPWNPGQIHFVT